MDEYGIECKFFGMGPDPTGEGRFRWALEPLGPWFFDRLDPGQVNWPWMLHHLYKICLKEKENLKDPRPGGVMCTLCFMKLYIYAGRHHRELMKFEDDSMTQFLKEIFVVFTGDIMDYSERQVCAQKMLKKNPARTQHALDYLGIQVEQLRNMHEQYAKEKGAWARMMLASCEEELYDDIPLKQKTKRPRSLDEYAP